jgi:hypothetical protein
MSGSEYLYTELPTIQQLRKIAALPNGIGFRPKSKPSDAERPRLKDKIIRSFAASSSAIA